MESNIEKAEIIEKELICDFFKGKKSGFFIEVGANEPDLVFSQTFHLEKNHNWTGILIEPIDYLFDKLKKVKAFSIPFLSCFQYSAKRGERSKYFLGIEHFWKST